MASELKHKNQNEGVIICEHKLGFISANAAVDESNTGKFSIEALPFVVNPNNDDIIHLDRYYDKQIDKENYELATEGKINLKLEVKRYGRTIPNNPLDGASTYGNSGYLNNFGMNIDIFSHRYLVHNYIDNSVSGQRSWSMGENDGIYLFKLKIYMKSNSTVRGKRNIIYRI